MLSINVDLLKSLPKQISYICEIFENCHFWAFYIKGRETITTNNYNILTPYFYIKIKPFKVFSMRGCTWESENVFEKAENYMLWYFILDEVFVTSVKTLQHFTNLALVKNSNKLVAKSFYPFLMLIP